MLRCSVSWLNSSRLCHSLQNVWMHIVISLELEQHACLIYHYVGSVQMLSNGAIFKSIRKLEGWVANMKKHERDNSSFKNWVYFALTQFVLSIWNSQRQRTILDVYFSMSSLKTSRVCDQSIISLEGEKCSYSMSAIRNLLKRLVHICEVAK